MSCILVNCLPNSHKSTPNFNAQFRTLKKFSLDKDAFIKKIKTYSLCGMSSSGSDTTNILLFKKKNMMKKPKKQFKFRENNAIFSTSFCVKNLF